MAIHVNNSRVNFHTFSQNHPPVITIFMSGRKTCINHSQMGLWLILPYFTHLRLPVTHQSYEAPEWVPAVRLEQPQRNWPRKRLVAGWNCLKLTGFPWQKPWEQKKQSMVRTCKNHCKNHEKNHDQHISVVDFVTFWAFQRMTSTRLTTARCLSSLREHWACGSLHL